MGMVHYWYWLQWCPYWHWHFCTLVQYQYWHGPLLVLAFSGARTGIGIFALWSSTSMCTDHYWYWHSIVLVPVMGRYIMQNDTKFMPILGLYLLFWELVICANWYPIVWYGTNNEQNKNPVRVLIPICVMAYLLLVMRICVFWYHTLSESGGHNTSSFSYLGSFFALKTLV
jgi:hypothetical protein